MLSRFAYSLTAASRPASPPHAGNQQMMNIGFDLTNQKIHHLHTSRKLTQLLGVSPKMCEFYSLEIRMRMKTPGECECEGS